MLDMQHKLENSDQQTLAKSQEEKGENVMNKD